MGWTRRIASVFNVVDFSRVGGAYNPRYISCFLSRRLEQSSPQDTEGLEKCRVELIHQFTEPLGECISCLDPQNEVTFKERFSVTEHHFMTSYKTEALVPPESASLHCILVPRLA